MNEVIGVNWANLNRVFYDALREEEGVTRGKAGRSFIEKIIHKIFLKKSTFGLDNPQCVEYTMVNKEKYYNKFITKEDK
jgi:hypothetical protein